MGTATDAVVAARLGRSAEAVRRHRQRLGTRAFARRQQRGKELAR